MNHMEKRTEERLDDLQIKGYKILQKTEGFCFGMDAVLLSAFYKVKFVSNIKGAALKNAAPFALVISLRCPV